MFDPPERVTYARTPFSVNEAPAHDQLAREMAQASIVLLKNNGVLPLAAQHEDDRGDRPQRRRRDDAARQLLRHAVEAGDACCRASATPCRSRRCIYARGVDLVEGRQDPRAVPPIPSQYLRPAAGSTEQGLKGEYFKGTELQGPAGA